MAISIDLRYDNSLVKLREKLGRTSADGCGPLGVVLGCAAEVGRREDRAGPALNPLKGSSARLPSYDTYVCTRQAKHKPLKTQCFEFRTAGKKAMPGEIFSGRNFHIH